MAKENILEVNAFIDYDQLSTDVLEKLKPELNKKQNIEEPTLKTDSKNIPGAINELFDKEPVKHIFYELEDIGLTDADFENLPKEDFKTIDDFVFKTPIGDILKKFLENEKFKEGDKFIITEEFFNKNTNSNLYKKLFLSIYAGFRNLYTNIENFMNPSDISNEEIDSYFESVDIIFYPIIIEKNNRKEIFGERCNVLNLISLKFTDNSSITPFNYNIVLRKIFITELTEPSSEIEYEYKINLMLEDLCGLNYIPYSDRFFAVPEFNTRYLKTFEIFKNDYEYSNLSGIFYNYNLEVVDQNFKYKFTDELNFYITAFDNNNNFKRQSKIIFKMENGISEDKSTKTFIGSTLEIGVTNFIYHYYNNSKTEYKFHNALSETDNPVSIYHYYNQSYPNSFIYENLQNIYFKNGEEYKKVLLQGDAVDSNNPEIFNTMNIKMDLTTNSLGLKFINTTDNKGVFQIGYNPTVESDENIKKYKGEGSYIFNEMSGNFLYFKNNGTLGYDGEIITKGRVTSLDTVGQISDERVKENFELIDKPFELIKSLNAYRYNFKDKTDKTKIGFKAQDVLKVIPEVVNKIDDKDENSLLSLSYGEMVPILVECIKEMKKEISSLKEEIECLKK